MPFGLKGAPGVFMNLTNEVLKKYIDNILLYLETLEEHVTLV